MELVRKKVHYLNWISFAKNCLVDLTFGTHTAGGYSGFYNMKYLAVLPTPHPLMGSSHQRITIVLGSCFIKQPWILNASLWVSLVFCKVSETDRNTRRNLSE